MVWIYLNFIISGLGNDMLIRNKGFNRFDIFWILKLKCNEKLYGLLVISFFFRYLEYICKFIGGEVNILFLKEEIWNKIIEGVKLEFGLEEIEVKLFDIKYEWKIKCINEGDLLFGKKSVFVVLRELYLDYGDIKRDVVLLIDGIVILGEKKCKICSKKVCGGIVICLIVIFIIVVVLLVILV